jgi:hypothetical protein
LKRCSTCKENKEIREFGARRLAKDGIDHRCKACCKISNAKYRKLNRLQLNINQVEYRKKLRKQVLVMYGNKCACCGEDRYEFLTFDHINSDGAIHRRQPGVGEGGNRFVHWLIRNNYPNNIQILCYNCNCSRGFLGYCPCSLNLTP